MTFDQKLAAVGLLTFAGIFAATFFFLWCRDLIRSRRIRREIEAEEQRLKPPLRPPPVQPGEMEILQGGPHVNPTIILGAQLDELSELLQRFGPGFAAALGSRFNHEVKDPATGKWILYCPVTKQKLPPYDPDDARFAGGAVAWSEPSRGEGTTACTLCAGRRDRRDVGNRYKDVHGELSAPPLPQEPAE